MVRRFHVRCAVGSFVAHVPSLHACQPVAVVAGGRQSQAPEAGGCAAEGRGSAIESPRRLQREAKSPAGAATPRASAERTASPISSCLAGLSAATRTTMTRRAGTTIRKVENLPLAWRRRLAATRRRCCPR